MEPGRRRAPAELWTLETRKEKGAAVAAWVRQMALYSGRLSGPMGRLFHLPPPASPGRTSGLSSNVGTATVHSARPPRLLSDDKAVGNTQAPGPIDGARSHEPQEGHIQCPYIANRLSAYRCDVRCDLGHSTPPDQWSMYVANSSRDEKQQNVNFEISGRKLSVCDKTRRCTVKCPVC